MALNALNQLNINWPVYKLYFLRNICNTFFFFFGTAFFINCLKYIGNWFINFNCINSTFCDFVSEIVITVSNFMYWWFLKQWLFLSLQLTSAQTLGVCKKELIPIFVSLAQTFADDKQFTRATEFYKKELDCREDEPGQVSVQLSGLCDGLDSTYLLALWNFVICSLHYFEPWKKLTI